MEFHEALELVVKSSDKATEAFQALASPWPPDKTRFVRASALFDQANAGIRDFMDSTEKLKDKKIPYLKSFRRKCRVALRRHRMTIKKVKPYVV